MTFTAESAGILKCTVHIPAQSDITGSVVYSNVGTGPTREVRIEASLTGIDYTHTAGTGIGACASGSATTGALTFKAILTGEEDLVATDIGLFLS